MTSSEFQHRFESTRWTLIQAANRGADSSSVNHALAELCEIYWFPLYAFSRKQGNQAADAQELVQEFFVELLGGSFLQKADSEKGKFRSFLLKSFRNFCTGQHRSQEAIKRGGNRKHLSIDMSQGESRYQVSPFDLKSPDQLFERQWALALLETAISRLKQEYDSSGKNALYDRLIPHLNDLPNARPYVEIAESLAINETAVKVAAYRMRKRYRTILRSEIAETLRCERKEDVDDELKWLISILSQ